MTKRSPTLAFRLTQWYAAIFVLLFGAAFLLFYVSIGTILDEDIDEDLEEDIEEFRLLMESEGIDRVKREIQREVLSDDPEDVFLRLVDGNGREIFSSDMSLWKDPKIADGVLAGLAAGSEPALNTMTAPDDDYDARVALGRIGPDTFLQIGESTEDKQDFMELLRNIFLLTFVIVVALSALVGWFMARQALRGVEEVTRAARDVANGALNRQVTVGARGAEIDSLVDTFNVMVERIRALMVGMREMTDNIAHDLRSPLARIRANAEMALSSASTMEEHKAAAADSLEECDRLLQMINTTLDVAEAEVGAARFARDRVGISTVALDACELFGPIAEDKGIALKKNIQSDCTVNGNLQYLQRMIANLLDNALKYTPSKGEVNVDLFAKDNSIVFSVRDSGMGIAESDQRRVFDRFFRCDASRTEDGCGLGLSLARAVARAHGGDIAVISRPGSGSQFTVTLPA